MNLWVIFLTGLTVGGLSCLAVQGGLLASVIAEKEKEDPQSGVKHSMYAAGVFLITKLAAYVILGFLLGAFGGAINIGGQVQIYMQLAAGIYMVAVALNLLNIHPIFRNVILQPPRFLTKLVKNQSKSKDIFAPGLLGAMAVFIPCGTTLAMEALAISSASALTGALIMAAFILGTMPLFFGIGLITSMLSEAFKSKFLKLAAVGVIYLGITSIGGVFTALGVSVPVSIDLAGNSQNDLATTQDAQINITSGGYEPNYIRAKKGLPVNLTLKSNSAYGCASAFRIPSLGISKNPGLNDTQLITFTPTDAGKIIFSCSMGMYRGTIEVI